jgi:hyperpolarization activated cyclic nucleotide-gated potassium channel 2
MFHPDHPPKMIWNVILSLLLIYTATVMPFRMAFIDIVWGDEWFWVEVVINALFFTDFLVNCFSAYYDVEGKLVTSRGRILITYAKTWMFVDLISCIPFEFFAEDDAQGGG